MSASHAPPPKSSFARLRAVATLGSGLGFAFAWTKLRGLFAREARRRELVERYHAESAKRVLATAGQMKGALMKLAQMASYVSDSLPPQYRELLAQLQSNAPPMEFAAIRAAIEHELGEDVTRLFAELDPIPLAAASIGQVHRARLRDGREVAVKVQYPGIDAAIRADLQNVDWLYTMVGAFYPALETGPVVEELRERLGEELDYANEARNQSAFAELYAEHAAIAVPAVIASHSTKRVLTMELARGGDFAWLRAQPDAVRQRAAEVVYRFVWGSMFRHRAFNGDPHPGNYRFDADGRVTFLDFGCVKYFDARTTEAMRALHRHHLAGDRAAFRAELVGLGFLADDAKVSAELYYDYMGFFYEPFTHDGEYTFTTDYTSRSLAHVFDSRDPRFGQVPRQSNMPRDFVLLNRLQWGLWPLLAELGARNHWHRIHREAIEGAAASTPLGLEFAAAEARWRAQRGVPAGAEIWLGPSGPAFG
jgi:predicted unusual protein kinase regulating ubiquinone biosynthesis (AarF/ABC1/UbiB family)